MAESDVIHSAAAFFEELVKTIPVIQKTQDARAKVDSMASHLDGYKRQLDQLLSILLLVLDELWLQTSEIKQEVRDIIKIRKILRHQVDTFSAQTREIRTKNTIQALSRSNPDERGLENAMTQLDQAIANLTTMIITTRVGLRRSMGTGLTVDLAAVQWVNKNVQRVLGKKLLIAAHLERRGTDEEENGTVSLTAEDIKELDLAEKRLWIDCWDRAIMFKRDLIERPVPSPTERLYRRNEAYGKSKLVLGPFHEAPVRAALKSNRGQRNIGFDEEHTKPRQAEAANVALAQSSETTEVEKHALEKSFKNMKQNIAKQMGNSTSGSGFYLSLPLLVDSILECLLLPLAASLVLQLFSSSYTERALLEGHTRVRWKSRGIQRFDDFVELDPGAAADLELALKNRYVSLAHMVTNRFSTGGFVRRILGFFRLQGEDQTTSDTELGSHELGTQGERTNAGTNAATDSEETEGESGSDRDTLRLLLCVTRSSTSKLHQEMLSGINHDRKLFKHLRRQVFSNRAWFTFRSVVAVSLTYFQVNYSNTTTAFRHQDVCLVTTHEHFDPAMRHYCLCIPPVEKVGTGKEYECSPAPEKSDKRRLIPVIGCRQLTDDFLKPDRILEDQKTTFKQLPKWRLEDELKATPEELAYGWGLHVEEGWHWPTIYVCIVTLILFSFLFSVIWSAVKGDLQGGFAVAAYPLSLGAMFFGYIAVYEV